MKTSTVTDGQMCVRSHVARDLLQNAALFRTDKLVVWEYVSNSLQYVDEGVAPEVYVTLDSKKKRITIRDNGRGMDWDGLTNFFIMHGENIDRKEGRPGRGRFGTGKAAAFGIADTLRVTSVRNGLISKVELGRKEIQSVSSEANVQVRIILREESTDSQNGTIIEIEGIYIKTINQGAVIQYIERHLAKWRNAKVVVNNHLCEFKEPPTVEAFSFHPEGGLKDKLGDIELKIKVSSAPLDEEMRGVSIYSNGVWYETTLAANQGREMAQYIFGDIDVPNLDSDDSPIPPFDLSRSMQLNQSNRLVQAIYSFLGQKIDEVRRGLVKAEKERRASAEARKLAAQAREIARIINDDFYDYRELVIKAKSKGGAGFDADEDISAYGKNAIIFGNQSPAEKVEPSGGLGTEMEGPGGGASEGDEPRKLTPKVEASKTDLPKQGRQGGSKDSPRTPSGGFSVEFKPTGKHENRALYVREQRTIFINLDHPQLQAAMADGITDGTTFKRLSYEVAFSEYAIALAHELNVTGEFIDTSDPIVSIRDSMNRIARKSAHLYAI